jgi:purine-binding chemotaxis protein CheW
MNAKPKTQSAATNEPVELITFRLGTLLLGIDIMFVKEINCNLQHTPVPYAADEVCGVINLRGEVLTVIDLARLLHVKTVERSGQARYVIVASQQERIALQVDAVEDVVTLQREELRPLPANFRGASKHALSGVYPLEGELLVVLDVDAALRFDAEPAGV